MGPDSSAFLPSVSCEAAQSGTHPFCACLAYVVLLTAPCIVLQVLGAFTVLATAVGCLYFMDVSDTASHVGKNAAGTLLLILNAWFVLWLTILITKASMKDVKAKAVWVLAQVKGAPKQGSRRLSSSFRRSNSVDRTRDGSSSALRQTLVSLLGCCTGSKPVTVTVTDLTANTY